MGRITAFELRRQSDDLVYRFDRDGDGFVRADAPHRIEKHPTHGWIAWSDPEGITGRPWAGPGHGDAPPEGVWVSRKGPKSYVYDLVHLEFSSK